MHCYDLFKLSSLKSMELVAGADGLSRRISWIYFADTVNLEDCIKWVDSCDLFVTTGKNLNGNMDEFCKIMPLLNKKGISGVLFNTGAFVFDIPENVKKCADDLMLPIFCLPWDNKLVDVTKQLCHYIISSEETHDQHSSFLSKLLFDDKIEESTLAQMILDIDFDFSHPYQIYYFHFYLPEEFKTRLTGEPNYLLNLNKYTYSLLQEQIAATHMSIMMTEHNGNLIVLAKATQSFFNLVSQAIKNAQDKLQHHYQGVRIVCGVGRSCTSPYDYRKSYSEAIKASEIAMADRRFTPIARFEEAGLFSLLTSVSSSYYLKTFYNKVLQRILEYDRDNGSDLFETMLNLLESSFSIQEVSSKMYLHKNTVKYRINKIESLLGHPLHDPETICDIVTAVKIGRLLDLPIPESGNKGDEQNKPEEHA